MLLTQNMFSSRFGFANSTVTMLITAAIMFVLNVVSSSEVVQTTSGPIQGITVDEDVEAFLGIPYAEPPVGELRFAKPVPKEPWTETFDASYLPPPCFQVSFDYHYYFTPNITDMTEDCLYLNIWTPKTPELKPIIFFIYSLAFLSGASNVKEHDGTNFARRGNVVVVTLNFRLGAFGFFSAKIKAAAGNMGMYDQVMALKWVKDNAIKFGGDPDNIVLMGVNAGAMSVGAHLVSPVSKNLFHKAIIESGSAVHPMLGSINPNVFLTSAELAKITDCANWTTTLETHPRLVVDCLKRTSAEYIVEEEDYIHETSPIIFFPQINEDFLPQSAEELFREGKFNKNIPILTGFNSNEGNLLLIFSQPQYFDSNGKTISLNVNNQITITIVHFGALTVNVTNTSEILNYYEKFKEGQTHEDYTKMLADMIGDYLISCSTISQADFLSLHGNPVYFYKFGFRTSSTPMADWKGATALDELQYVLGNPFHEDFTGEEIELSNRMMDRWSAFARTGNPNIPGEVQWPQYRYDNPSYLNIGQEEESVKTQPSNRCDIWRTRFNTKIE